MNDRFSILVNLDDPEFQMALIIEIVNYMEVKETYFMKKFLNIISITLIILCLSGCTKVVNVEQEEVQVKVVDEYHHNSYMVPMRVGKGTQWITYPATYQIKVEYGDTIFTVGGAEVYRKYKDKIGTIVSGTLETVTYDDGTKHYDITELN